MKNILIGILLFYGGLQIHAQIALSSCDAPDSIRKYYYKDAVTLALLHVYDVPFGGYRDSIGIPQAYIDTFLGGLIAVYNDTVHSASDSACRIFPIHARCPTGWQAFQTIVVEGDSNLAWIRNLRSGNIPTGYDKLDSFLVPYRFTSVVRISNYQATYGVTLQSDSFYNMSALLQQKASQIPGASIGNISSETGCNQVNIFSISESTGTGFVDLYYQCGFDNCPIGCIYFWEWRFRIYPDCRVDYLGDSLYDYSNHVGVELLAFEKSAIYPNPASNSLMIDLEGFDELAVTIYDLSGRIVDSQVVNKEINISSLSDGIYYVVITNSNDTFVRRFIKQ